MEYSFSKISCLSLFDLFLCLVEYNCSNFLRGKNYMSENLSLYTSEYRILSWKSCFFRFPEVSLHFLLAISTTIKDIHMILILNHCFSLEALRSFLFFRVLKFHSIVLRGLFSSIVLGSFIVQTHILLIWKFLWDHFLQNFFPLSVFFLSNTPFYWMLDSFTDLVIFPP